MSIVCRFYWKNEDSRKSMINKIRELLRDFLANPKIKPLSALRPSGQTCEDLNLIGFSF